MFSYITEFVHQGYALYSLQTFTIATVGEDVIPHSAPFVLKLLCRRRQDVSRTESTQGTNMKQNLRKTRMRVIKMKRAGNGSWWQSLQSLLQSTGGRVNWGQFVGCDSRVGISRGHASHQLFRNDQKGFFYNEFGFLVYIITARCCPHQCLSVCADISCSIPGFMLTRLQVPNNLPYSQLLTASLV